MIKAVKRGNMISQNQTDFIKLDKYERIMAGIFCFFGITGSLAVYQNDTTLAGPQVRIIIRVLVYIAFVLLIGLFIFNKRIVKNKMWKLLIPIICFCVTYFHDYSGESSLGLLIILILCFFLAAKDTIQAQAFEYFKYYMYAVSAIGIIIYVSYLIHFPFPHRVVQYYSVGGPDRYIDYTVCYLYTMNGLVRLCGLFNEPGYYGTILALVLCSQQMNMKKKLNIVLFVAGCLTFSLSFIIIILGYLIFMTFRKPGLLFLWAALLFLWFLIIPNIRTGIIGIDTILKRLTIVDGHLQGDNRKSSGLIKLYEAWKSGNNLAWGYGGGYVRAKLLGWYPVGSSFSSYLINYGIIGTALLYIPTIVYSIEISKRNMLNIAFVVVFCLSIYQRPNIFCALYYLILIGGIQAANKRNEPDIE